MSRDHGNNRFDLFGSPELVKLYNGRYRVSVRVEVTDAQEDWYSANKNNFWKEFGAKYGDPITVDGKTVDWEPDTGEEYDNLHLVSTDFGYLGGQKQEPVITLIYETLTNAYVQETDDAVDVELNGLRRVTRTLIAQEGTAYTGVAGQSFITDSSLDLAEKTLYLGTFQEDQKNPSQGGFTRITEQWLERGEIARREDFEDSRGVISITYFGDCPEAPDGYTAIGKEESNVGGFKTCTVTYAKDGAIISRSKDKVGSQVAVTFEVFNGTADAADANDYGDGSNYTLANEAESNVDGIPTRRYTFLESGCILSESYDYVGSQKAVVREVFDGTPFTPSGYRLASTQESDWEGIPTKRYTFLEPSILTLSQDFNNGRKRVSVSAFALTDSQVDSLLSEVTSSHKLISQSEGDYEGIKTSQFVYELDESFVEDYELNGLKRISLIELSLSSFTPYEFGTPSATAPTTGLYLATQDIDNGGAVKVRQSVWIQEGLVNTASRSGPTSISGTTYITYQSVGLPHDLPVDAVITESRDIDIDGFTTYIRTILQGDIEGIQQEYKDVVDVFTPGTVECTTEAVSSGGVSGTIAVTNHVPPRRKKVAATVTVEITTDPPDTISLAYDLGQISCSVTSTNVSLAVGSGATVSVSDGSTSTSDTGYTQSFSASANIQTYPGSYLTQSSSTGTISYIASSQPVANGNIITRDESSSSRDTTCTGTGSTSADGYVETGVIKRVSRPVFSDIDGITYYEVITWSV